MIAALIGFCGRNRFVVFLVTALMIAWAIWAIRKTPLDALPDISDTQVIIFTEWMGRSPNLIEDQITYPMITTFLSAPKVKVVRGLTMFGMSFIYVIFEDGTDMYWARSRVLEYLSNLQGKLPEGVTPQLGPDATGVGWVYQYAIIDETGKRSLQELRSFQDWYLKYWLAAVPGVSEVASVGGYEKEYQVEIDPVKLQAYNISITAVKNAIRMSNNDVGGRVIEMAEHEYVVRGRGYITDKQKLELVVVGTDNKGTPILIRDIARVQIGGNIRRGFAELNGTGEAVGGIVVMRYGENARAVINRVKNKLNEMTPAFPKGIKVEPVYDRSELIDHSTKTIFDALFEEILLVFLFIMLFLFHFRSSLVAIVTLPIAVAISFIPMYYMGLTTNVMSLAGIIIGIGDIVDAAVVLTENAHKKIEDSGGKRPRHEVVIEAAKELGPSIFSGLLITVIAFIPVFLLQAQEGRLFLPLAYTKTFSVLFGAVLGVTLVPALMTMLIRGNIRPEMKNPINKACIAIYKPILHFCVRYRYLMVILTIALALAAIPAFMNLGSEFMPPLDEEALFFMPVTTPGISIETAKQLVQKQDKIFKSFPEVKTVFGKAGRAETPTDPAPLSMIETLITFKPKSEWRSGMTKEKLLKDIEQALRMEGLQSAFTMPIKARIDMLTTGIRTPIGIKVFGDDLRKINEIGQKLEGVLRRVPGTRSVYADRELGGFFIDFIPDRQALARYGLRVMDVFDVIETAIGGLDVATTIEGRERYKINVRYPRELRNSVEQLKNILVPIKRQFDSKTMDGMKKENLMDRVEHVPLGLLGKIEAVMGAPMIKNEMGSLSGWVYVDTSRSDIGGYVYDAKKVVEKEIKLPTGYYLKWTGQYEYLERIQALMKIAIPLILLIILILLFMSFGGLVQTFMVMLSVPFAALGAIFVMYYLDFNTSVAVWVGMIALFGIAAQTASIMVVYLDEGYKIWQAGGRLKTTKDLIAMVVEHGAFRVRPLLMAVGLNIVGLIPIMMSEGVGADVAKRISAPLWGGLMSLTFLTLLIIPAVYVIWREIQLKFFLSDERTL